MKTIILNGSPKAKRGNGEIFINHFTKGMKGDYEVRYIVKEDPEKLAAYAQQFDALIFVFPIYIHSMPGGTMRVIEHLKTCEEGEKKSSGFIYQRGGCRVFTLPSCRTVF